MVVVFMNSAEDIWERIRSAVLDAGFSIDRIDIFDKQHGTFKHFVSDNTAGADLMLHCRKPLDAQKVQAVQRTTTDAQTSVADFLKKRKGSIPMLPYLHVKRDTDIDYRTLYSEFLSEVLLENGRMVDFASFRAQALNTLENNEGGK